MSGHHRSLGGGECPLPAHHHGPRDTYPHTACPPRGSQACRSTCRRWACSDTGHWDGSHPARGHTRPHLQKSTAAPGRVPRALCALTPAPLCHHLPPAFTLHPRTGWGASGMHPVCHAVPGTAWPFRLRYSPPFPSALEPQLRATRSRRPTRTPAGRGGVSQDVLPPVSLLSLQVVTVFLPASPP